MVLNGVCLGKHVVTGLRSNGRSGSGSVNLGELVA